MVRTGHRALTRRDLLQSSHRPPSQEEKFRRARSRGCNAQVSRTTPTSRILIHALPGGRSADVAIEEIVRVATLEPNLTSIEDEGAARLRTVGLSEGIRFGNLEPSLDRSRTSLLDTSSNWTLVKSHKLDKGHTATGRS